MFWQQKLTSHDLNHSTWPPVGKFHTHSSHTAHTAPMAQHIQAPSLICYWKQRVQNSRYVLTHHLALHLLSNASRRKAWAHTPILVLLLMLRVVSVPWTTRIPENFVNSLATFFCNCNISWILNASKKLLVGAPISSNPLKAWSASWAQRISCLEDPHGFWSDPILL